MPDSTSAPALFAARPKFFVAGQEQQELADALVELAVEEDTEGLCHCEATFSNWGPRDGAAGYLFFDRQLLDFGTALRIELGAGDTAGTVFDGKISAIEGRFASSRPPEVLVLAEDRLQDLRMTRHTRTYEQVSDEDVARQIASRQGLQAVVDVSGPTHRVLAQLNQSDLAFLRERARAVDAEVWVEGGDLHVQQRARRSAGQVTLTFGAALHDFTVSADLAGQVTEFDVTGWDVSGKQAISESADGSVISGELQGDTGGGSLLQSAFGDRKQQVVHHVPLTSQEARALAEAHYRRVARRFVTGSGVADGDARLRVGAHLTLGGLGELFDGQYVITRSRHSFDSLRGARSRFDVERPGIGS